MLGSELIIQRRSLKELHLSDTVKNITYFQITGKELKIIQVQIDM
jgi:hypothetical protein